MKIAHIELRERRLPPSTAPKNAGIGFEIKRKRIDDLTVRRESFTAAP